jgi:hypothetical protein
VSPAKPGWAHAKQERSATESNKETHVALANVLERSTGVSPIDYGTKSQPNKKKPTVSCTRLRRKQAELRGNDGRFGAVGCFNFAAI